MTVEELLVFGKSHCHSEHAKILLAELLNKNSLELLNYLNETVDNELCEKYKEESETSIYVDYGKTKNPVRQYSYFIAHEILDDISGDMSILEPLCHAGLFGKGTNTLPSGYTVESYEFDDFDDDSEYSEECELSFELNKNGTINYEESGYYNSVQFEYEGSASKEDAKATRSIAVEKKKKSSRGLMKKHRKTRK